jgi:hypothetical protein
MRFTTHALPALIGAFCLAGGPASAQVELDCSGGLSNFGTIQAAIDAYVATCNGLGGTITVASGTYGKTVFQDVDGGPGLELRAGTTVSVEPGNARGFEFKSSGNITLRAEPGASISTGTNEPIALQGGPAANHDITIIGWSIFSNGGGRDSACIDSADGNSNLTVVNVICRDNGSNAIHVGEVPEGSRHYFINNTVARNVKGGFRFDKGARATLVNNLVVFNGKPGGSQQFNIEIESGGSGPAADIELKNNVIYGGDGEIDGPFTDGGGNLFSADLPGNPGLSDFFVGPAASPPDFHLAAGSPAIDVGLPAGSPPGVPATDFEGDARIGPADDGYDERLEDADFDGIADFIDNCPPQPGLDGSDTWNPKQKDGDGDAPVCLVESGCANLCDNCPNMFNPDQADSDGDGTGDVCDADLLAAPGAGNCPSADCEVTCLLEFTEATDTVPPACQDTLSILCSQDRDGDSVAESPIPRRFYSQTRAYPGDIETIPANIPQVVDCKVGDYVELEHVDFDAGAVVCVCVYESDLQDPDGVDDPTFRGEIMSNEFEVNAAMGDEACSPGYFKNNPQEFAPTGLSPADPCPVADAELCDFDTVFGTHAFEPDISLMAALNTGGGDVAELMRKGTSGLLSARHPGVEYPLTEVQVKIKVRAAIDDNPPGEADAAAKELPVSANSPGGCPLL